MFPLLSQSQRMAALVVLAKAQGGADGKKLPHAALTARESTKALS
jgi:hypothetical protein